MLNINRTIKLDTSRKEVYINDIVEDDLADVVVDFSCTMNNESRELRGNYRLLLYPDFSSSKIELYVSDRMMDVGIESIARSIKEYATSLKDVEQSKNEYMKVFDEVMKHSIDNIELVSVKFAGEEELTLAKKLERFLELKDITHSEVYRFLNINKATFYRRLQNDNFTAKELVALINKYNIPADYF